MDIGIRTGGILLIAVMCAGMGFAAAAHTAGRTASLRTILSFLHLFTVELRCSMGHTETLIRSVSRMMDPPPCFTESCVSACEEGKSLPEAWSEAVEIHKKELCLEQGELAAARELGNLLGRYDRQGQTDALEAASQRFEEMYHNAVREEKQKAPLYRTLGMLGGAAVVILLW